MRITFLPSSVQTEEVLSKDSAEELNEGKHPGPLTEIR
jgi:hypothetical protein